MQDEKCLCSGIVERIGDANSCITYKAKGIRKEEVVLMKTHTDAFTEVMKYMLDKEVGVIKNVNEIIALGHRIVHSGEVFSKSVLLSEENLQKLDSIEDMAPLHNPAAKTCVLACKNVLPNVPNVGVFDTSFHATMPKKASLYGIPFEDYQQFHIRKYGFHGTSHKYVSRVAIQYLKSKGLKCDNIVTCHLGNGSSICAVKDGKCVDTSMGLTPLAGVLMGTRSGDIDPAVVGMLCKKKGMNVEEVLTYLNKKSGFLGISGKSSDCRDLCDAANSGDERAKLALEMFAYQVKKYIGSYSAAMNGLDCVVMTGGIGENSRQVRGLIVKELEFLGIDFDFEQNEKAKSEDIVELTKPTSRVKVLAIKTNEELVIAQETKQVVESLSTESFKNVKPLCTERFKNVKPL